MYIEIIITLILIVTAGLILVKNIKNKSKGNCDCDNCSSHCSRYKK